VVAVLLIATATVLSPVAVVAGWTRLQLTSEQAFLDTFAPLANDPRVQQYVADRVVAEINNGWTSTPSPTTCSAGSRASTFPRVPSRRSS
jgi:hypothetical protein